MFLQFHILEFISDTSLEESLFAHAQLCKATELLTELCADERELEHQVGAAFVLRFASPKILLCAAQEGCTNSALGVEAEAVLVGPVPLESRMVFVIYSIPSSSIELATRM